MTGRRALVTVLAAVGVMYLFVAGFAGSACAQQPPSRVATATVQPATVTVGDSVTYQVAIVLTGAGQPSVHVPVIDPDTGLSTPSPAGTQTSLESYISNGGFRSIQRITYNYTIRTSKAGTFTIPPSTVTIDGNSYETESVDVEVRPVPKAKNVPSELEGLVVAPQVSGNPELQRKLTGVVFVLPVVSNTEPYNGEQVRISYHLVIDPKGLNSAGLQPRTNLDGVSIPAMNEFISEELYPFPQDLKFQEREIGGNLYLVAPVYEAVITSTKTGKLQIEPFQISMLFSLGNQSSRRRSPFPDDPFLSSYGPFSMLGGNSVSVIAQSPTLTFDVKPVPDTGRPSNYAGAVGDFEIKAEVDKKSAKAYDDVVELDVTIEGQGNAESLAPPKLPELPGFTILGDPEQQVSGRKDGDEYVSSKRFSYTIRPTRPGTESIPPIEMSYFHPEKKQFITASSDAITLEVAPGSRPGPPTPAPVPEPEPEAEEPPVDHDLRYISTESLTKPGSRFDLFTGVSGAVMFLLPPTLLFMAGVVAWNRHRNEHRQVDPGKVAGAASSFHLKQARQALESGQTKKVAAEMASGIRLFFASRYGISEAEATIPEIEERLAKSGAPAETIRAISQMLEGCDSAQYAPGSASHTNAREMHDQAIELLKRAEKYI